MAKVRAPDDNQVFYYKYINLSSEGFATVSIYDLLDVLSRSEINRRRAAGAIRIKDTVCTGDEIKWIWRPVNDTELVECGDVIRFGKNKYLLILRSKDKTGG
jgi:hypothetical protein